MKNTKKLLALVLAMMMALSVMAMTAAAYEAEEHVHECTECCEDEGIMPRKPYGKCPVCGELTGFSIEYGAGTGKIYHYDCGHDVLV